MLAMFLFTNIEDDTDIATFVLRHPPPALGYQGGSEKMHGHCQDLGHCVRQDEIDKGVLPQGGEPKAAKFETEVKYGGTLRRQLLQLQSL